MGGAAMGPPGAYTWTATGNAEEDPQARLKSRRVGGQSPLSQPGPTPRTPGVWFSCASARSCDRASLAPACRSARSWPNVDRMGAAVGLLDPSVGCDVTAVRTRRQTPDKTRGCLLVPFLRSIEPSHPPFRR